MSLFESYLFDDNKKNLASILNSASAGIWEFDVVTKSVTWSNGLYKSLGYEPGEIECTYINFIENLIYHKDKLAFLDSLHENTAKVEWIFIRLLTKQGYQWFQSWINLRNGTRISGTIINIHNFKLHEFKVKELNDYNAEANKLMKFGSWEFDVDSNVFFFSKQALKILEVSQINSAQELADIFISEHSAKLSEAFGVCINFGKPFDLDLKLAAARPNNVWIKIKALADIDNFARCVKINGVIQDINFNKQTEVQLKSSLNEVGHHNKRLQNFAYIVSHNLRSYVGNLSFMINLHNETTVSDEKSEVFDHIKTISNGLSTMVDHLNEIVKVESQITNEKTSIGLELLFTTILSALQSDIKSADAVIEYDFSKCPYVYYLPAYLESIFFNLLTNALKYRSHNRRLSIKCKSFKDADNIFITFEDNGTGIDLSLNRNKIFGMYETFHGNSDAQGIGLYITRNQVEALGGSIDVESTIDVGTKFIVRLG
jgi:signal transduction histidine kinase